MKNILLITPSLILMVTPVFAQAPKSKTETPRKEPISTDRPDFVESSLTVGKGVLQIETSIATERSRDGGLGVRTSSTPTLFRVGFSANMEFRVETDGAIQARSGGATQRGTADTALGIKWHVQDGEGNRPSMAWLFHADLASGSPAFRGSKVRPSVRAVFEWELPNDMGLGIMPGLVHDSDNTGRFTTGILAATVSKGWTDKLRSFVELAAQELRSGSRGGNTVTFDAGVTYLVNDNLQLDLVTNQGMTKDYRGTTWGLGISRRY